MTDHWSNHYIGIPYESLGRSFTGADCWGLLYMVFRNELQIDVPRFDGYDDTDDLPSIHEIMHGAIGSEIAMSVIPGQHREFDVLVFRRGRMDSHVGIVIDNSRMLHMAEKSQSRIEDYTNGYWSKRLTGIVRHKDMIFAACA